MDRYFPEITDEDIKNLHPMFHKSCCEYEKTEIFQEDCVYCMWLWNEFLDKNNIYVTTGKGSK